MKHHSVRFVHSGAWRSGLLNVFAFAVSTAMLFLFAPAMRADYSVEHPPGKRLLLLVGSNTLGEVAVPELAKDYLEKEKNVQGAAIERNGEVIFVTGKLPDGSPVYVEIHATGSGDCFKSFLGEYEGADARCDIGMASRPVYPGEAESIKQELGCEMSRRGAEPGVGCEHPVGMDGVAIVVPASNPINRISFSELKAIYSRKITDWSQVADWKLAGGGEKELPIVPVRRKEPSGTLDFFKEKIEPASAPMSDEKIIAAFTSSSDLVKTVMNTPGGIGFVGRSYAMVAGLKRLQVYDDIGIIKTTGDQAVFPDNDTVRNESYPLSRVVYLYTLAFSANTEVAPFLRFALSDEGQAVIADKGGMVKITGTEYEIVKQQAPATPAGADNNVVTNGGRKENIILRLDGSNTVGAECAVNLAYNYFMLKRQNPNSPIMDTTTPLETPEGEKALAHDIMCDVKGDGTWEVIQVRPTGSSDAFRDLHQGLCDIGMSSRPITDAEKNDLLSICGNLAVPQAQFVLGMDGLAIIVSKENKVDKITLDQLRHIFVGEITNWSELGGENKPIHLHTRPDRSGTYKYFCDKVLLGRSVSDYAKRHPENSEVTDAVTEDPDAIGFVPMAKTAGAKVLKVAVDGSPNYYLPSAASVPSGQYPLALCRYVYFYVPPIKPNSFTVISRQNWETAREFAAMSQDWRGQAVVAASGFITETSNADDTGLSRRAEGEKIMDYLQRLGKLEKEAQTKQGLKPALADDVVCPRLVFQYNTWALTAESQDVIDLQLGSWLKMFPAAAKRGLVVEGWADSGDTDEAGRQASLKRAQLVATYLSQTLGVNATAVGKGKSSDVPDTSEENKQQNRRVVIKLASVKQG